MILLEKQLGNIMEEMKQIAKGANVIEGIIFDQNHKTIKDYQKFVSSLSI